MEPDPNIEYVTIVIDRDSLHMLVAKFTPDPDDNRFEIPHLSSAAVPHFGYEMCESFTMQLNELTEGSFELTFLYATINETYHRHIPMMYVAIFECTKPVKPILDLLVWKDVRNLRPENFPSPFDIEALPYAQRVLEECSENGVRPWEKPGWFKATSEVATATLANLGYRVISPFEQFNVSPASALLRVQTDKGRVYLKASNKREGRITECISSIDPKLVRKPLYVDSEREWMLMEDYGPTLDEKMSQQDFEKIKDLLARLQRESSKHIERLIDAGVPRVDPGEIVRKVEKMLRDVFLSEGGGKASTGIRGVYMSLDENSVRSHCQYVRTLLKYMYEKQKVPLTICHEDLYDCNVIKCDSGKDNYVVIDWGVASIDYPLDEMSCLASNIRPTDDRPEAYEDLYLEHWVEYESLEELERLNRRLGLKFSLLGKIKDYEYAVDKGLRPYLVGEDVIDLCKNLDRVKEEVQELSLALTG